MLYDYGLLCLGFARLSRGQLMLHLHRAQCLVGPLGLLFLDIQLGLQQISIDEHLVQLAIN